MRNDQRFVCVGPRVKPEDCAQTLRVFACFVSLSFAGLVVLARSMNPIPSRTRPLNSSAPMVLWLKPWESRSLPGLPKTKPFLFTCHDPTERRSLRGAAFFVCLTATGKFRLMAACRSNSHRSTEEPSKRERADRHRIRSVMLIKLPCGPTTRSPDVRSPGRRSPNSEWLVIIRPRFGISLRRRVHAPFSRVHLTPLSANFAFTPQGAFPCVRSFVPQPLP